MSLRSSGVEEIDDHSGPLDPDLRLHDFSKERLKKLVEIVDYEAGKYCRQQFHSQRQGKGK